MQSYELFSRRNKTFQFDVLTYDSIPNKLRNQIYFIWKYALAADHAVTLSDNSVTKLFETLHDVICREHGLQSLGPASIAVRKCEDYLKKSPNIEVVLDLIEFSMRLIKPFQEELGHNNRVSYKITLDAECAIEDLNKRFRENGIGYEFLDGILIRKDSEILHAEVTKPALQLLQAEDFDGALEEFLKAHDHYRKANYGDSILNAGKAFESTMKTIGHKEAWGLTGRENASDLIKLLIDNNVIPVYLQNSLIGLGTVRNKVAGHGQGAKPVAVPEHLVNYALHLCGTNIVMLIEAYKEFSKRQQTV